MGSSLVKQSRRESRRRGADAASASRGDVRVSNDNLDGKRDEGYKVDTLNGPVSNYCKPVTVISQSDNVTNRSILLVSNESKQIPKNILPGMTRLTTAMDSEYVSPVLKKDYSFQSSNALIKSDSSTLMNNKLPGKGNGDSTVGFQGALNGNQQKSSARRRRFLSGSCIGKRNEKLEVTTDTSKLELPREKNEVKFKESENKIHTVKQEHDDQDVSRDARTPSPEFNDFENVIVTDPRASTSSPIEGYIHLKDSEAAEAESPPSVSIKRSDNPAPVHQGELMCELRKEIKMSSEVQGEINTHSLVKGQGDTPSVGDNDLKSKSKQDATVCGDQIYEKGDLGSEKIIDCGSCDREIMSRNSITDKMRMQDFDDENTLQVSESFGLDVEAQSDSCLPQTNGTEEQNTPICIQIYGNNPNKENEKYNESGTGDNLTYFKTKENKIDTNLVCVNLTIETQQFQDIPGPQGCATGATKCFCDFNQFDYENGDEQFKCEAMHDEKNADATEVSPNFGIEGTLMMNNLPSPSILQEKKEERVNNSSINPACGTNKSEPDMSTPPRISRLNCWRPESGGCAVGKLGKDKKERLENRPASWSHIDSQQQHLEQDEVKLPNLRPCSVTTGDTLWGNEGMANIAVALGSTSSSALDVSPSPSNTSLPRRQKSHQSVENNKSCHSVVMNVSDTSSRRACKESRILPVTSKTSVDAQNDSFKAPSTNDLVRGSSSQRLTLENVQKSRSISSHGSQTSVNEPVAKLSQHSLPRLSARNSIHSLSRSLSNHSSLSNSMHSPRPPSADNPKHSPRPPSGLSEENYPRKVRSRPSSVQLSCSLTTTLKRFSDQNLSKEPCKKSSSECCEQNNQTYTLNKADSVTAKQTSLHASQIKLPPIKTTTNMCPYRAPVDSRASIGQSVCLPPLVATSTSMRPFEKSLGDLTPSSDSPSSWPISSKTRGSSLPPVSSVEANLGKYAKQEEDTKNDGRSFTFNDKRSPDGHSQTPESAHEIPNAYASSETDGDNLREKSEQADPNPSPTGSEFGVEEISHSLSLAQKTTSTDLARLLAEYLPQKYSAGEDSNALPSDIPAAGTCAESHIQETHNEAPHPEQNKDEAGADSTKYSECVRPFSDVDAEDNLAILPGEKDDSVEVNNKSDYLQRNSLSENTSGYMNSEHLMDAEDTEIKEDVCRVKTITEYEPTSPALTNYDDLLAKYSTSTKENLHKFETSNPNPTTKNENVANCTELSETTTYWSSNPNEGLECKNLLDNYLISNDVISSDGKTEPDEMDCYLSQTNTESTIPAACNLTSNVLSKLPGTIPNPSGNLSNEEEENVDSHLQSCEESKLASTSPAFDISSLMAKYCPEKLESRTAPTSVHTNDLYASEESTYAENGHTVSITRTESGTHFENLRDEDSELRALKTSSETKMEECPMTEEVNSDEKMHPTESHISENIAENNIKINSQDVGNGQGNISGQFEAVNEFNSSYGPTSECLMDLTTPKCLEDNSEENEKLNSLHTEDYMTELSERMSSFGERFISSDSGMYPNTRENVDTGDARDKTPYITNVLSVSVDDDKTEERENDDSQKEILENDPNKSEVDRANPQMGTINESFICASITNTCPITTSEPEDEKKEVDNVNNAEYHSKIQENNNEENADLLGTDEAAPLETCLSNAETKVVDDNVPGSGDDNIQLQDNTFSIREESEHCLKDVYITSSQVDPSLVGNEKLDDMKRSPNDDGCCEESTVTLKANDNESEPIAYKNENCDSESVNTLSSTKQTLEINDKLAVNDDEMISTKTIEPSYGCQIGYDNAEIQHDYGDPSPDFLQNDAPYETALSNTSLPESHSGPKDETEETCVPDNLPSERIDTIKKQIYEEGLKPCQRDGGVAFFIPVSNAGLQPPVNNPEIGERLAKTKKPSMSYEERMMMADINRQEQLTKKKEFAMKDLINVKSATTSSSSASGENISGGGQHDHSDRSESGSLH
ncbi:hypothetical protein EGW08_017372 [Elysia chlorotica]|uniref:Uncharacterized protein n=1 Tax=Elysia chlorotica TaxID=188477 RepID=A0A433SZZ3_ELYCH|nr:hypothetical protein EGW08_017372 [Elysia chlorotica]